MCKQASTKFYSDAAIKNREFSRIARQKPLPKTPFVQSMDVLTLMTQPIK